MTPEEVEALLAGTCNDEVEGMDTEDAINIMVDLGYEKCPECEWWVESCDLYNEDDEPCSCDSCGNNKVEVDYYCDPCRHLVSVDPSVPILRCGKYDVDIVWYDGPHRTNKCISCHGKEVEEILS